MASERPDFDAQDQAETLDESMTVGGEDMRTFVELPDVLDVTQAAGDRDDDEAAIGDADLQAMGYSETRGGETRAKPER